MIEPPVLPKNIGPSIPLGIFVGDARVPTRYEFTDGTDQTSLQVQQDLFAWRWQRQREGDVYPGYATKARTEFLRHWRGFCGFVEANQLGPVKVRQCEITYLDMIPVGQGWNDLGDVTNSQTIFDWSCLPSGQPSDFANMTTLVTVDEDAQSFITSNALHSALGTALALVAHHFVVIGEVQVIKTQDRDIPGEVYVLINVTTAGDRQSIRKARRAFDLDLVQQVPTSLQSLIRTFVRRGDD